MSYSRRRYYTPNLENPEARGICDRTGFVFKHSDLVQQMEWRGDSLEWTGLMVGRPFLNKPNEQLRNPELFADPVPVHMPKPPHEYNVCWSNQFVPWISLKILNWTSWSGSEDGVLAAPEAERLAALEAGTRPEDTYQGAGSNYQAQSLTPEQLLESLENYNWSAR
jgi:hypothetical protein